MNKYGQSLIEYALIAVLVIIGIVIMGAYVLRSTNTNFKLWDEGVQDSFQETLTQVSQNKVPYMSTNCVCTNSEGSCGTTATGVQCGSDQREYEHSCTPSECDGEPQSFCVYDQSCCNTYQDQGCGTDVLPANDNGNPPPGTAVPTTNPDGSSNGLPSGCITYGSPPFTETVTETEVTTGTDIEIGTTVITNPGTFTGCYYGQEAWATPCSTKPVACCPKANCDAMCTGVMLYSGSVIPCANSAPGDGQKLLQDFPYTYVSVDSQADCAGIPNCSYCGWDVVTNGPATSPPPCQVYCNQKEGYLPKYGTIQVVDNGIVVTRTIVVGCQNNFTIAPIIHDCSSAGACGSTFVSDYSMTSSSTDPYPLANCSAVDNSDTWTAVNDCSFTICTSMPNSVIKSASATCTTPVAPCADYSCCTDNDANPDACISTDPFSGQPGATPSCPCLVTVTMQ